METSAKEPESRNSFTMLDENGKEQDYEVILSFRNHDTGKNYLIYTDNSVDMRGRLQIFASRFNPEDTSAQLYHIDDENTEEWAMIEATLSQAMNDFQNRDSASAPEEAPSH